MAVNKVVYAGEVLIDLTNDTVTPETLLAGTTAHDAAGNAITGTAVVGSGGIDGTIDSFVEISQTFSADGSNVRVDADGNRLIAVINADGSLTETYQPIDGDEVSRTTVTTFGSNGVITDVYTYSDGSSKTRTTTIATDGSVSIAYS